MRPLALLALVLVPLAGCAEGGTEDISASDPTAPPPHALPDDARAEDAPRRDDAPPAPPAPDSGTVDTAVAPETSVSEDTDPPAPPGDTSSAPDTASAPDTITPPDDSSTDSGVSDTGSVSDGVTTGDGSTLPTDGIWSKDKPYYNSASELCDYVNASRKLSSSHERYKGFPWKGAYHSIKTWPISFTHDLSLDTVAQLEADRLAKEGTPVGGSTADSSWRNPIWVSGTNTSSYMVTSQDEPGDWDPTTSFASKAALIESNGSARMGLFYQDPGGGGPVLTRMGCGGALALDGKSKWWVVVLRP